jgi:hypothetical protein
VLTLRMLVWSMEAGMVGSVLRFVDSGDDPRQQSMKFVGLRKLRLDSFLPDDLRRQALLHGYSTELGVASTVEFLIDTDGKSWMVMRDREDLRINGWEAKD